MESPVKEGLYQPSLARERYYEKLSESIIEEKVESEGTINDEELNKETTQLKSEKEAENEHNILNMTQVDYV